MKTATATKIEFQRIVRDCPANDAQTNPARMIYDFEVLIDGEHRATWHREFRGHGYELRGLHHDGIFPANATSQGYHDQVRVPKKADFVAAIEGLLIDDRIPTAAECFAMEIGWGRAILEARDAEAAQMRAGCIKQRAAELFQLAVLAADGCDMKKAAGTIIAQIDRAHEDAVALTRKHSPLNKFEAEAVAKFEAALAIGEV